MSWIAKLNLNYTARQGKTHVRFLHHGPLRVLKSLYPEGDHVCHTVCVHPPSGLVGGDELDITVGVEAHAHALITTPGATRFYRSPDAPIWQRLQAHVGAGARLEWLPLEAIVYNGAQAHNHLRFTLDPTAEVIGWDFTALGLITANEPFTHGYFDQRLEVPGVWLEQGLIRANDKRLLDGALGLSGHRCMGTLFFVSGSAISRARREQATELALAQIQAHGLAATAGVSCVHPQVLTLRVLGPVIEPMFELLSSVRAAWRSELWQLTGAAPRIWNM